MPEPDPRATFLAAVARELHLDPDTEFDVLDELASHVEDSTVRLVEQGREPEAAEKEALRRLGDPRALGQDIRRAHHTRRRLLAAVGGGLLGAADGAARSLAPAIAVVIVAMIGEATGWSILQTVGARGSEFAYNSAFSNLAAFPFVAVAGFGAARRMAWAVARAGHRPLGHSAAITGPGGALAIGSWFLVGPAVVMDWRTVLLELTILATWTAGSVSVGRVADLRVTTARWLVGGVAYGLVGLVLILALTPVLPPFEGRTPTADLSRAGVLVSEDLQPSQIAENSTSVGGSDSYSVELVPPFDAPPGSTILPQGAIEPRLELWAALPRSVDSPFADELVGDLDPSIAGPLRAVSLTSSGGALVGSISYGDLRGLDRAWLLATAVVRGRRTIVWSEPVLPQFRGNLSDWIISFLPGATNAVHRGGS